MNIKDYRTWRTSWVLVLAVAMGTGAVGLLYAQQAKPASPLASGRSPLGEAEGSHGLGGQPSQPATSKSQEDVLKELLKDTLPKPLTSPEQGSDEVKTPPVKAVDPKAKIPFIVREGDVVINRLGRLDKDAKGSALFVYEADGSSLTEPPLILLPCQKLEQMEGWAKQKPDAKFAVTGEVMVYHNQGYLLLRKVMLYRDMGQF